MESAISRYLAPVAGSLRGYLSASEYVHCLVTALASGVVAGGLVFLEQVQQNLAHLVRPDLVPIAVAVLTFLARSLVRINQGATVVQSPQAISQQPQTVAVVPAKIVDMPAIVVTKEEDE